MHASRESSWGADFIELYWFNYPQFIVIGTFGFSLKVTSFGATEVQCFHAVSVLATRMNILKVDSCGGATNKTELFIVMEVYCTKFP